MHNAVQLEEMLLELNAIVYRGLEAAIHGIFESKIEEWCMAVQQRRPAYTRQAHITLELTPTSASYYS